MAEKISKYLSVRAGTQWYGANVDLIIEVLHLVAFTQVSALKDDILGFITLRNEMIPLIDMRRRLGSSQAPLRLDTPIVAMREEDGLIAMVFDEVDQVEQIDLSKTNTFQDSGQIPYVRAVASLPERLLLLLDTNAIARELHEPSVQATSKR